MRLVRALTGLLLPLLGLPDPPVASAALPFETDRIALAPGTVVNGANRLALNRRTNRIYLASVQYVYLGSARSIVQPGPGGAVLGVVDATSEQLITGIELGTDFSPGGLAVDDGDGPAGNKIYVAGLRFSPSQTAPPAPALRVVDGATNTLLAVDDTGSLAGLGRVITIAVAAFFGKLVGWN